MDFQPWAFLIGLPPILGAFFFQWKMGKEMFRKKTPLTEPLLRPPGESCRIKIDALTDEAISKLILFIAPIILSLVGYSARINLPVCLILFSISLIWTFFVGNRLWKLAVLIKNYRLGFDGERAVGQELNQVLAIGGKVYHDVQFEEYNIDHVIVVPSGVYSVETKTRSKGHEKNSHRVKFDGLKLIFPEWDDIHGLDQAHRNAKSLAEWLSKAVGEPVTVEPILTLPGWMVERVGKGKVNVLNPKEILRYVNRTTPTALSPQMMQRISHQIAQRSIIS